MKIGVKHIALFVIAVVLIVVGYKHEELATLWKGKDTVISTPTPDVQDAIAGTSLPFDTNRLERDRARAKTKEFYQEITTDGNATDTVVTEAYDRLILLAQQTEQEGKVEGLIREKGFADAYACFSDKGEIDVLVQAKELTETQVTQIADIIVRYTGLDYSAIHIRKVA